MSSRAGVLAAGPSVHLLFIGNLGKEAGGEEGGAGRGSLNEFVNQTRTSSLNGPLKPRLTVDRPLQSIKISEGGVGRRLTQFRVARARTATVAEGEADG